MTTLPRDALSRLAWKYETLAGLRRARDRGEPVPGREVFRSLAAEFPGCLAELDTLPLDEIDARALALATARDGALPAPWMDWLAAYHGLLRAALWLKPRVGREPLSTLAAARLAEGASAASGVDVDAAFVAGVADPPSGRLVALVLTVVAETHGRPVAEIRRALFPRSRR